MRVPFRMIYGLSLFAALLAVLGLASWMDLDSPSWRRLRASLDLPDGTELLGGTSRRAWASSSQGEILFDASGPNLRAWTIDEEATHWWTRTYGTSELAIAARGVPSTQAIELAALSPNRKSIRFYRFRALGSTPVAEDLGFSLEYSIEAPATLGLPRRILYRPGAREFVLLFEKGWLRRYQMSDAGEISLVPWHDADEIRLHSGMADDASFSEGGGYLATVHRDADHFVRVLRFGDELLSRTPDVPGAPTYYTVAITRAGDLVAAARGDGSIDLFRARDDGWILAGRLPARGDKAELGLAFRRRTGELLAAGHDDISVWDHRRGVLRHTLGTDEQIMAWRIIERFDPPRLLAVDEEGEVSGWYLAPGKRE